MRQLDSPTPSPARKRQRLSSPPYEGSIDLLSQDDLASIDALESKYLQSISSSSQSFGGNIGAKSTLGDTDISNDHADDTKNPFLTVSSGFAAASLLQPRLEMPISRELRDNLKEFNNLESELGYDAMFRPASDAQFPEIQAESRIRESTASSSAPVGFASAGAKFMTAGKKSIYAPSRAALAAAQAKIEAIWNEEEVQDNSTNPSSGTVGIVFAEGLALQKGLALKTRENALDSPRTPLYSTTNSSNLGSTPLSPLLERLKDKGKGKARDVEGAENVRFDSSASINSCGVAPSNLTKSRPFVSPLTRRTNQPAVAESSLNLISQNKSSVAAGGTPSQLSTPHHHFVTPRRPSPTTSVAQPYSAMSIRKGAANRPFVTPFKPGIRAEDQGNSRRKDAPDRVPRQSMVAMAHLRGEKRQNQRFFQLTLPENRVTLESSGLIPQQYEVDDIDMSLIELTQITPSLAPFYSFNSSDANDSRSPIGVLNVAAAFDELKRRGCSLATKSWVDNHWSLILWKLSGMALLNPSQEEDPTRRKWCWSEVIRQLLYRYERELNQGKRPALRMITTQDASAAFPMVLCISDIFWSERGRTADELASDRVPELEVTDGWYRLRAAIDTPMARALGRGVIRIGRKIGVAGARLSSEKKEPSEVLEAYSNVKLLLSGNSSHLMPWHAKLGFQRVPFISTLHSLTNDGGCVTVLNVLVNKVYPVAYFEFFEDGGQKRREGPRSEAEETRLQDKWKKDREQEARKLHSELNRRFNRFENYADRLSCRAGPKFNPTDDESPPANMEELYDLLEDSTEASATLARLNSAEAGWLARHIRTSIEQEKARASDDIERDLEKCYPKREIRSFRVVVVQDASTRRRPANRIAQITVWDALDLFEEESTNALQVAQKYLVTNLMPTQRSAWMNNEPGSQIFLSTRRDSRWTKMH